MTNSKNCYKPLHDFYFPSLVQTKTKSKNIIVIVADRKIKHRSASPHYSTTLKRPNHTTLQTLEETIKLKNDFVRMTSFSPVTLLIFDYSVQLNYH
jgi:uncharacterized membrane protein